MSSFSSPNNIAPTLEAASESADEDLSFLPLCAPCEVTTTTLGSVVVSQSNNRDEGDDMQRSVPPIDRMIAPGDVVDIGVTEEVVHIVGTLDSKVTCTRGLRGKSCLKVLTLRSCLVSCLEELDDLVQLEKLELYDNVLDDFNGQLVHLKSLVILDISFNSIRDMSPVSVCVRLKELYIAQNKLREIRGLELLKDLRILDLGANRIRSMDGLQGLTSLESLWLGKNKIEFIEHVGDFPRLRQLDLQNNRLTAIGENLLENRSIQELYLSFNAILSTAGLPTRAPLSIVDLSNNKLKSLESIDQCNTLEELWLSGSAIESIDELECLKGLSELTCVYLEHSPVAKTPDYRRKVKELIPWLQQLDADLFIGR